MPREQVTFVCIDPEAKNVADHRYYSTKNPRSQKPKAKEKMKMRKYHPGLRRHADFVEKK